MSALACSAERASGRPGDALFQEVDLAIGLLAATWMQTHEVWPKYTTDLGLEALLACFDATGDPEYLRHVQRVWDYRHPPRVSLTAGNAYFTCLHYETYLRTSDDRYVQGLVELADEWTRNGPRDGMGAIGHRDHPRGALFLDLLGGLAPLLARAGALSGEGRFFDECVRQIQLYRDALFDPRRGLWHHARDWHGRGSLSPPGWCRGSGWVLRGLEKSLLALPKNHPGWNTVEVVWLETIRGLLVWQNSAGLWRQLIHCQGARVESSGSGLILAALASPVVWNGALVNLPFDLRHHLRAGMRGLLGCFDNQGALQNGCPECPPLPEESDYLHIALRNGDPHATAGALLGFAGARRAWAQGWL